MTDIDEQTGRVIAAILDAAVTIRDESTDAVHAAVSAALEAAGGDPIAALSVAAALIRVDQPVDRWWQTLRAVPTYPSIPVEPTPELDDVAIERRIFGERIPLSKAELTEAVRRLAAAGYNSRQSSERLHVSARTVERHRAKGQVA